MKIITKLNIAIIFCSSIFLGLAGWYNFALNEDNAVRQVTEQAELLLDQINALRSYTVMEVRPLLESKAGQADEFHPQSVPAYAATQVANLFSKSWSEYSYKEAVVNPTNLRDKAAPWEESVINEFREDSDKTEIVGNRIVDLKKSLFVARPIRITNGACLECHSTPEAAPASMIKKYGDKNGFGWKLGEVVGMQMIIVPFTLPDQLAKKASNALTVTAMGLLIIILLTLNISYAYVMRNLRAKRLRDNVADSS